MHLPLVHTDLAPGVDALTAHALRLALWPQREDERAAVELYIAACRNATVIEKTLARVERALAAEPSRVLTDAATDLRAARALVGRRSDAA
jgi:hypothetical protein